METVKIIAETDALTAMSAFAFIAGGIASFLLPLFLADLKTNKQFNKKAILPALICLLTVICGFSYTHNITSRSYVIRVSNEATYNEVVKDWEVLQTGHHGINDTTYIALKRK